ncbi:hypothetical protein CCUS01_13993 [Colletotrichum cuscutae]|uniref:Uncharacterized protein n=1 Tax=Colletotrichum cuscutae TaxID=1209917 RepID=A0AAI9YA97_9PEZI|nr:hypothetical protein CCUS01_13993 [Colletotrichum cuscutae]
MSLFLTFPPTPDGSHGTYTSLYTSPSRRPLFPCTGDLRPGAVHSSSKVNAKSRVSCPLIGIRLIILMTVHLRIVKKGGPSNKGSRRSCMGRRRNHKPSPGPPNFRTTLPPYADCDDDDPYELGKKNEMRFDSSSGRERRFVWLGQSIVFFNLQARQFR